MEIGGTNSGASAYAMKKAMEMPNMLLNLLSQTTDSGKQSLGTKSSESASAPDPAMVTGKGQIIDLTA